MRRFATHTAEAGVCLSNFDISGHDFALRHVWIICVSAFDLYMTELVSEVGLQLIDRSPPVLTQNLRQVQFALDKVMNVAALSPTERLLFFRDGIYGAVQYRSFYRPEKVSEALSYIWTCPPKEKWTRIVNGMKSTGRYAERTEEEVRAELTSIGNRRDLIAHSSDKPPGADAPNPVGRTDAARVLEFISDLALSIDRETEYQLGVL